MRRCILIFVNSLLIAVAVLRPAARAEVIISEIMYDPAGTDNDITVTPQVHREWVELYNTGASAVDLSGWQFGDSQDNQYASAFPTGTMIGPSQALIVTGDSAHFDLEWGTGINRVQVSNWPTLANDPSPTDETAALRDNNGVFRDKVNFDNSNGWPVLDGSDGQSIFLIPQGLSAAANDIGTNWKPSMHDVYGAAFRSTDGENHGSPGTVATIPQAPTFAPSPDAAWSMVFVPDTQNYVKSSVEKPILTQMTTWIKDHRDEYKIKAVLQGGDIVNNNNTNSPTSGDQVSTQQWQNAQTSFSVLNGYVPYIMAAGNHDFGFTNADNRDTQINSYFKPSDNPLVDPAQGGIMKGEMVNGEIQNAYYAFTAPDGRKMLVFSLEWEPRPATVTWANSIAALSQYADYTAVLLTHNYLQADSTRSTTTDVAGDASGETLWQNLVKTHSNFEMVFNGHFGGDGVGYLDSTDNAGKTVHQMFLNTQFEGFGGDGWIRLAEFLNDGKTVRIRTYSPFHDLYRDGPDYNFTFQLTPLPSLPGDYNGDHVVNAADYILYRKYYGSRTNSVADANHDGIVNEFDYQIWRQRYGNPLSPGAGSSITSIPEPSTIFLLLIASLAASTLRRPHLSPAI
jgi:hypothetical protein